MPRGGARNRSGPPKDPNSGASARAGFKLRTLDAAGYSGTVPPWPLSGQSDREVTIWLTLWSYPQAIAWVTEPHRWFTIAMYARTLAMAEHPGVAVTASTIGNLHRFADQIGLTPAGLKENGWQIGAPEAEIDESETGDDDADVIELFGGIADAGR